MQHLREPDPTIRTWRVVTLHTNTPQVSNPISHIPAYRFQARTPSHNSRPISCISLASIFYDARSRPALITSYHELQNFAEKAQQNYKRGQRFQYWKCTSDTRLPFFPTVLRYQQLCASSLTVLVSAHVLSDCGARSSGIISRGGSCTWKEELPAEVKGSLQRSCEILVSTGNLRR